ncbi:hypothetical protein EWB00_004520 [Schistosoma japonicum]|uniref:Uncharacterized protein n=1 Tax=Schistosoma japonicum TaxID=6182 RepID=A0A4Z2DUL6_SCHJA|nr:hypothetical protein KSF78_0006278 [Schistosoma japonicum]TNN20241.1 hypothetical protein EWB00_004520 [Schistosoma japonicum]
MSVITSQEPNQWNTVKDMLVKWPVLEVHIQSAGIMGKCKKDLDEGMMTNVNGLWSYVGNSSIFLSLNY